jgi:peptide deformylase
VTVLPIVMIGDPILRAAAPPVSDASGLAALVDDLVDTMRHANGAGIAANQIGSTARVCVAEVRPGNPRYPYKPLIPLTVLVNPTVEAIDDETFDNYEGCLSVPDLRGVAPRYVAVRVRAFGLDGSPLEFEVRGLSAGTFQHEVDHLNGMLFVDRVVDTRTFCTWDQFDLRHRADFEERARRLVARFGS